MKYRFADDIRIYKFIEEIRGLSSNNNIKGFEASGDITAYLKEQLAGLFQRLLEDQIRVREVSLISNLEKTAQTLNKLVNFLSDENKENKDEVNKILMINHPLISSLKDKLKISYNFYIEGLYDLGLLLQARGFKENSLPFDPMIEYENKQSGKKLIFDSTLFENEGKLRYIKASDWNDDWVKLEDVEGDELPF